MNTPKNKFYTDKEKSKKQFSRDWLPDFSVSREGIFRSLPFISFLVLWAVVYIANRHYAEKTEREISIISREVKDLRADYLTTKSELMFQTKQSEVARMVEDLGLKELKSPPRKLETD